MSHPKQSSPIHQLVIVGCGGVASYLLPCLLRTFQVEEVGLIDGDVLELRNLDRQLFGTDQVGKNKAEALAELLSPAFSDVQFSVLPEYFHEGTDIRPGAIIVGCVDNHAARNAILQVADRIGALVVLAGNEYTEAQAFVYLPQWKGTPRDPRVRYPEIVTDQSDDPRRPQSCQGAEQRAHPQLAMANFSAANFALWLLWFYLVEAPGLDREMLKDFSPVEFSNTFNRFRSVLTSEVQPQPAAT